MTDSRIVIRRARVQDAEAMLRIMGDPTVFGGLMQLPYPSLALWQERLGRTSSAGSVDLSLVAERDGEVLGSAGLHPVGAHLRRRHAAMLGISVASSAQRQGLGSALMKALCDYADGWAQILRIELTVFADNAAAIALYRRFDFEVEGTHRAYALRDGAYVDVHTMARLHPRPPTLRPE